MRSNRLQIKKQIHNSLFSAVREGGLNRLRELVDSLELPSPVRLSEGYNLDSLCTAISKSDTAVSKLLSIGASVKDKSYGNNNISLHYAVLRNEIDIIKDYLKNGVDINAKDKEGLSLLHLATKTGNEQIVEYLLNCGAHVDCLCYKGYTPLHYSAEKGRKNIVSFLISKGATVDIKENNNKTPLHMAINSEHKEIVKILLQHGAKVHIQDKEGKNILHYAVEKGNLEIVQDILKYGTDVNVCHHSTLTNPLPSTSKNKQKKVAKESTGNNAFINAQDKSGRTPLIMAVEKENLEIVQTLLQYNADVNASDEYGRTALHFTASSDDNEFHEMMFEVDDSKGPDENIMKEICKLLLNNSANVNSVNRNGSSALHTAINNGYEKIVEVLLESDANVNLKNNKDITPLHLSVEKGHQKITKMLLNNGAKVNAKQQNGSTALHIAIENDYKEIIKILLDCGANVNAVQKDKHLTAKTKKINLRKFDMMKKHKSGFTPLLLAALLGDTDILEIILNYGADIDHRDTHGRTALHIASYQGHGRIVEILLKYGANLHVVCKNNLTVIEYAYAGKQAYEIKKQDDKYCCDNEYIERSFDLVCGVIFLFYYSFPKKIVIEILIIKLSPDLKFLWATFLFELTTMKKDKIVTNLTFYDILLKGSHLLVPYMKNQNVLQVIEAGNYKTKYPLYASMIENNFNKAMERKQLLEEGDQVFHLIFNNLLPHDCISKILSYVGNKDLQVLLEVCKPRND